MVSAVDTNIVPVGVFTRTEQFAEIGLTLMDSLHEGSISRYGIRQSQFHTWRDLIDAPADAT